MPETRPSQVDLQANKYTGSSVTFKDGNPQKRIAALELYVSRLRLLSVLQWSGGFRHIPIAILTDNKSNSRTMLANRSKKWPSAAILMELSLQLHVNRSCLAPSFTHQERQLVRSALRKGYFIIPPNAGNTSSGIPHHGG